MNQVSRCNDSGPSPSNHQLYMFNVIHVDILNLKRIEPYLGILDLSKRTDLSIYSSMSVHSFLPHHYYPTCGFSLDFERWCKIP